MKFDIAASATEGYFSRRWVTEHVFGMSHEEFIRNQREMYYDRKHDAALQQVAEAAAAAGAAGLGGDLGGDLGGELGGDLGGPAEIPAGAVGGEEGMPPEGGEAAAPAAGEEGGSPLLAVPPGSRNSPRITITAKSKGKAYSPVKSDRRPQGAARRHRQSQWAKEKTSSTLRNIMPGMRDMQTLKNPAGARGIYEENESIYSLREKTEENKLFRINNSVKILLEDLEKKENLLMEHTDEDKA
jgi:hypothetical protein